MFRQLARLVPATTLFDTHPAELAALLEDIWEQARNAAITTKPLGHPFNRSNINALLSWPPSPADDPFGEGATLPRWDHLIYAYMIENTRIHEILRRVVFEYAHGERLGTPLAKAQRWLRTTEELFYKDGAPFLITSLVSHVRRDLGGIRRNAYQRMFDMELNHGGDDGKPYPYVKAEAANSGFVATFEEFLREVWVGMTYVKATTSADPTDRSKIATLAEKLFDMLGSRRQNGNLSREEFNAVTALSWMHLSLEFATSPIVESLRADATGTDQILFKVAERVKVPAHALSKHFFEIADPLSRILIQIETGTYNKAAAVPALYTPVTPSDDSPEDAMRQIITHWTAITGRDMKARKVTAAA